MSVWDTKTIHQLVDAVFGNTSAHAANTASTGKAARRKYLTELRQILNARFNRGELRTLCADLGVDYHDLPGEGTGEKARELIEYLERHNRLSELVELGRVDRPDISWPHALPATVESIPPEQPIGSEDLKKFSLAHFRPVYDQFTRGISKEEMIRQLVAYCERHSQTETLLERVREKNPPQYAIFAPRLRRELSTPDKYFDLEIRIQKSDPDTRTYAVEAQLGNGGLFDGGIFCLDQDRLGAVESDPQEYGTILFDALFSGPIFRAYDRATVYADLQTEKCLRIRLWIDNNASELHELAWERLHHRVQDAMLPIAASRDMPFSRYIGLTTSEPAPVTARPVRLLFAISNPANLSDHHLASLDVEKEVANLIEALGDLPETEKLQVTLLPGRTGLSSTLHAKLEREGYQIYKGTTSMDTIIRALSRDGGYHILHYLGHGQFSRRQQQAYLFLENEDGNVEFIKDEKIAALLNSAGSQLRLVFLAACESAKREQGESNPFVGLAPKLIQVGIPAVVAMQDDVSFTTARKLTYDFYSYLLECGIVDRAMNQARLLLFKSGGKDWATPVLFMRLKNGRLFG